AGKPEVLPPLLDGHDLIALGMPPGPAIGRMLEEVRDRQLQEELKSAEEARAWVRERLGKAG
ncbi:MAG: CCA tRNA nucleotidyltransferase, partial [Verrucomicrobia bacterium]|nr:CCA tRNA nucleotidyltransferase [Verrucomicrobiota bacterium]